MNQPFTVTRETDDLRILRDDLIPGGTKSRALDLLLNDLPETDISYAGTIFGHGALALALACDDHGKTAHLFLSSNDDDHSLLELLRKTKAIVHVAKPEPVAALLEQAARWSHNHDAYLFLLGFNTPGFHIAMIDALRKFDISPYSEIWCSSVSGTLARCLKSAFPRMPVKIVSVVAGGEGDFTAPEKYHQPARTPPSYPSCPYTDAKVWPFALRHAASNALIWNTAG